MTATKSLLFLCFQLCFLSMAQAGETSFYKYLTRSQMEAEFLNISSSAQITLEDPFAIENAGNSQVVENDLYVHLIYGKEELSDVFGNYFSYSVTYNLEYLSSGFTISDALEIVYDANTGVYQAVNVHNYGSGDVRLTITGICGTVLTNGGNTEICLGNGTTDLNFTAPDIRLELELKTNKVYELEHLTESPEIFHEVNFVEGIHSEIKIAWGFLPGFESYELEYVFWDSEATDTPIPGSPDYDLRLFKKATRLETWHNHFVLDASYPSGTLHFRVRSIGRFIQNVNGDYTIKKHGRWSAINSEPIGEQETLQPFESNKNWQYAVTFAEEGKSKKILTYYDGSLRSRQVLTHLNGDNISLVAESKYSLEGQGLVDILPAPAIGPKDNFFYKERFNTSSEFSDNLGPLTYGYLDFDKTSNSNPLHESTGAGKYFSANNDYGGLYRDYTPNANGFPFTQSKYLRDATGRMAAEGGLGDFHKLGSGRDTRYYYLSASATDLHRVFGSNVGSAQHYKKNIVVDPNGQISVAYMDQTGKVIATAIAGQSPDNVIPLVDTDPLVVKKALLVNQETSSNDLMSRSSNFIFNAQDPTTYSFAYNLEGAFIDGLDFPCQTCEYELTIFIINEDGELILLSNNGSGSPGNVFTKQYLAEDVNTPCANYTNYPTSDVTFSSTFTDVGTYEVIKELRVIGPGVNVEGLEEIPGLDLPDLQLLIETAVANIDFSDCDWSCEAFCDRQIREEHPEYFNPDGTIFNEFGYNTAMAECNPSDCIAQLDFDPLQAAAENECEGKLQLMKAQVSPDGLFYEDPGFQANPNIPSQSFLVEDINGDQFTITGNQISPSSTTLVIRDDNYQLFTINDAATFFSSVLFDETLWQEQWADALVLLHREYCLYVHCVDINTVEYNSQSSYDFDLRITQATQWTQLNGSLTWDANNPLNFINGIFTLDPVYQLYDDYTYQLDVCEPPLNDYLLHFTDALENYTTNQSGASISILEMIDLFIVDQNIPPANVDELRWQLFRGAYLEVKQRLLWTCIKGCEVLPDDDPNAIFRLPPDFPATDDQALIDEWIEDNVTTICSQMCMGQADIWLAQIENYLIESCGVSQISLNDQATIHEALLEYCNEGCDPQNLNTSIIAEIQQADIDNNPHLIQVNNIVLTYAQNCPGDVMQEIITEYGDYTFVLPPPCLVTIFQAINDHVLPSNSDYMPPPGDPNLECFNNLNLHSPTGDNVQVQGQYFDCPNDNHIIIVIDENSNLVPFNNIESFDLEEINYANLPPTVLDDYPGGQIDQDYTGYSVQFYLDPPFNTEPKTGYLFNLKNGDCFGSQISNYTIEQADCEEYLITQVTNEVTEQWQEQVDEILTDYYNSLYRCNESVDERFCVSYEQAEYQYTLYYYDQAANLVQTVAPAGVDLTSVQFDDYGNWDGTSEPIHTQKTTYKYNTLEQSIHQQSPDGGESFFAYNEAAQLRFSQNARQDTDADVSYTKYDQQTRVYEVGQLQFDDANSGIDDISFDQLNDPDFPYDADPNYFLTQKVTTTYDLPTGNQNTFAQQNMRNRISKIVHQDIETRYSYDIHGNVTGIEHLIAGLGRKNVFYDYDLISGNVHQVNYQPGAIDQFFHRFEYDADNRITHAYTSPNGVLWDNDARYFYYLHGPLARAEIGNDKVQGMDYFYTIQGWIKGVNLPGLKFTQQEPGLDGYAGINQHQPKDEMAYLLGYFKNDYQSLNPDLGIDLLHPFTWDQFSTDPDNGVLSSGGVPGLFNGNIAWMITNLDQFDSAPTGPGPAPEYRGQQAMIYQYDQLHRIKKARSYQVFAEFVDLEGDPLNMGLLWQHSEEYDSDYSYDPNGNIKTLVRRGPLDNGSPMDNLKYFYDDPDGPNRLTQVFENSNIDPATYPDDVDGQLSGNYEYDEIGNLIKDDSEKIKNIEWTVFGKVKEVEFTPIGHALGKKDIRYTYDATGNRLTKSIIDIIYIGGGGVSEQLLEKTYYARDTEGKILSIYKYNLRDGFLRQQEVPLYGSKRLGQRNFSNRILNIEGGTEEALQSLRGEKIYELSNHLGNALATISDQKHGLDTDANSIAESYKAEVNSGSDYYPFGMAMAQRKADESSYRYGFNGKEKEERGEFGAPTHYDFGARFYNPAIGRWLSIDPLASKYPGLSPYNFVANTPIQAVDPDGEDIVIIGDKDYQRDVKILLGRLAATEGGRELLEKALSSDETFIIQNIKGANEVKGDILDLDPATIGDDLENGLGMGKELKGSATAQFGHEISHLVFDTPEGSLGSIYGIATSTGFDEHELEVYAHTVEADEAQAVHYENIIRSNLGLELRTHYGGRDVFNKKITAIYKPFTGPDYNDDGKVKTTTDQGYRTLVERGYDYDAIKDKKYDMIEQIEFAKKVERVEEKTEDFSENKPDKGDQIIRLSLDKEKKDKKKKP